MLRTFLDGNRPRLLSDIAGLPGNREALYSRNNQGILETLVQASERDRSNIGKRWGASG